MKMMKAPAELRSYTLLGPSRYSRSRYSTLPPVNSKVESSASVKVAKLEVSPPSIIMSVAWIVSLGAPRYRRRTSSDRMGMTNPIHTQRFTFFWYSWYEITLDAVAR